ncbi:docking protein 3 [Echinococcus multilocularis]|uniref:Docking protein 3 n=1 Tax=Echinococcus multilocularis TaxID=6211 RepID=A0A068YGI1_ECHMU|nr:docking protein 3 [Echinococcus multilocularis]
MSINRSGFLWQIPNKQGDAPTADWIAANLEISGRPNKLVLVADPADPIYESVDEDDRKIRFRVNSYKRCLKITGRKTKSPNSELGRVKSEPIYQIALQKRRLLKGEEVKIGFNEKASQRLFLIHIREALKGNKESSSSRLHCNKRARKSWNKTLQLCDINEIDKFMTENKVYEKHDWSAMKVQVVSTELATRLQLRGIFLLELKEYDMCLLDYITMLEVNRWPFKSIRSFGFHDERLYILTGSQCIGGRGLLIFESEKCADLMNRMICMMKTIAGESETPTEETVSLLPSSQHSKPLQPPLHTETTKASQSRGAFHNHLPMPTKKSMQDLSASLQDFCRTHCCSLPPLRGRNEAHSVEVVADIEPEVEESQTKNLDAADVNSDDDLSLDALDDANVDLESFKEDLEQKLPLTRETTDNVSKPINGNDTTSVTNVGVPKDVRKRTPGTVSLKKSLSELISHSMARIESMRLSPPPPPSNPSKSATIPDSPQNADHPSPPVPLLSDCKPQGLCGTHKAEASSGEHPLLREQGHSRRTDSAKAVQLIKWRDLPGKEDYYSSTSNQFLSRTPEHSGESDYRGSDDVNFVANQCLEDYPPTESPSIQEDTSLPSSTSTTRDRQILFGIDPTFDCDLIELSSSLFVPVLSPPKMIARMISPSDQS